MGSPAKEFGEGGVDGVFVPTSRPFAGAIKGAAKYGQEVEDYDAILLRGSGGSGAIAIRIVVLTEMTEWALISRSALLPSLILIGQSIVTTIGA